MSSDEEDIETRRQILAKLEKYGDSLLGDKPLPKKKKRRNPAIGSSETESSPVTSKKKKKKTKKANLQKEPQVDDEIEDEDWDDDGYDGRELTSEQRHLEEIKKKLGLTGADFAIKKTQSNEAKPPLPKAKSKKRPEPDIIVFNDPAKRKQRLNEDASNKSRATMKRVPIQVETASDEEDITRLQSESAQQNDIDFDMKRAKFDVMMLGIKGLDKVDREKARMDVAVKLGAKPPKRAYVNYKQLMEDKRKEKIENRARREEALLTGEEISKANIRKRRQRDKNDIGFIDGQVGEYKSGVQVLKKNDLKKMTSSPRNSGRRGGFRGRGRGGRR